MAANVPVYDSGAIKFRGLFEARELFRYQFLLRNLIVRDLKIRYKRSFLGFLWVMVSPFLTMGVMAVIFAQIFRFGQQHYAAYLLSGMLIWTVFAQGTVAAMASLRGNGSVLRRMYIPPSVFIASAIGSAFVNLIFSLGPFVALAYITGVSPTWWWLMLIFPCIAVSIFSFGVGLALGGLAVFFNDITEIYVVILTAYNYATPVFWPLYSLQTAHSTSARLLASAEQFNPMFLYMNIARDFVLFGAMPPLPEIAIAGGYAALAVLIGWLMFTRMESKFAYNF